MTYEERFWSHVDRSGGPEACWPWLGSVDHNGHGRFATSPGVHRGAHRIAYSLVVGPISPGLSICHTCDNPPCCNPAHLFEGSVADNMADMAAKGRGRGRVGRGEENGFAKLTWSQVRELRAKAAGGTSQAALARDFGLCSATVSYIVRGLRWIEPA